MAVQAIAVAALVAEFNAYLDRERADPVADLVGYHQHAVWRSREGLGELIGGLRTAIVPVLANEPTTRPPWTGWPTSPTPAGILTS